ncbi:dual specificity phosphatase-like protein [Euroglyphus maynei]|uniref:Dual specificity phosphatase-like protein n=1 Tax=Euroglyphus maynei TaxID=6958 RepID=A0A1Y3BNK3_EURMA|nr:dual specificity phosphatase-like protein [Euroglyphus maynei]
MGVKYSKYEHLKTIQSPLNQAQTMKLTRSGLQINQDVTSKPLNKRMIEKLKRNPKTAPDVLIILSSPFCDIDRITDHLYLTGMGGLTEENLATLSITCIVNATYEMPLLRMKGIESYRVPVDDDGNEEIILYFDDVANLIHSTSKQNGRTIVHCMAGASRSSTLVLAYLIKFHDYNLKTAFCYVKSLRSCARPNIGFFSQLIAYERYYRKDTSVEIIEIVKKGKKVQVPDFYPAMFPELFKAEVNRQLNKSHISNIKLQESKDRITFN